MNKIKKRHHSITENGKLQVRIITEYQDDEGNVLNKKYSAPYTPSAISKDKDKIIALKQDDEGKDIHIPVEDIGGYNLAGWDQKSKDIITAVTSNQAAFEAEYQHKCGVGVEEVITHDRVINEDGKIAVRRITRIFDDGKEVDKKYHRSWIVPGDDFEGHDTVSKALSKQLHTKSVKI